MPRRGPLTPTALSERVHEYWRALGTPGTYAAHRNPYILAGFLWGLPVPAVAVALVQWASGGPVTPACCAARLLSHPVFLVFALHPFLFAVLFGAFGTIRERKAQRIRELITELEAQATTDGLTGLVNQRHFHRLLLEAAGATGQGHPAAVVLLDMDRLKLINDAHGHAQGDAALRHLGGLIQQQTRAGDIAARAGGDEFGVLMYRADAREAGALAERLRRTVESTPCHRVDGRGTLPLSVSIGVASLTPAVNAQEALTRADQALYQAKTQGRNRVIQA